jgi:hypothetical protein
MNDTIIKNELIQKISAAFSEVEYPGDDSLVDDSYGDEPDLVRNHFVGHNDWKNLTYEFLDFDGALSFLSDKAFRFYIPAFIIADIDEKLDYNDPTVRLCWSLTPQSENEKIAKIWGGGTMGERARKCFDEFPKEQVSAIVSYLNWRLSHDEYNCVIEQAMSNYWLKREKNIS